jgi:hypothetical protein
MKNIKEFIALAEKYEVITLDEIKEVWDEDNFFGNTAAFDAAQNLTGFGRKQTCTLCSAVNGLCNDCVYGFEYGCISKENEETYLEIENSETPIKLKIAFRKRAEFMRNKIKNVKTI